MFFARYEACQFGREQIEPEHLLLGLLREDKPLAMWLVKTSAQVESIRAQMEAAAGPRPKSGTSVDLPLSEELKRILAYATEEAERLRHSYVTPAHLVLGILREPACMAAKLLEQRHVGIVPVRAYAADHPDPSDGLRAKAQQPPPRLLEFLADREKAGGIRVTAGVIVAGHRTDFAIYASPAGAAPLLCIVLPRGESLSELRARVEVYLKVGVAQVWILDQTGRRAYTVTADEGLRESASGVLRAVQPNIELDWRRVLE